jgi:hypothetical protein
MKKTYVYFIAPLVALVVFFFGFYWSAHKNYEAREEGKVKAAFEAKKAKLEKEAKDREKAVMIAIELQEKRRADKKARDLRDAQAKEKRDKDRQARDKAGRDAEKLEVQVRRLQKEIDVEKRDIGEIRKEQKRLVDDEKFLREYVKKAEANVGSLKVVLERIAAADKAAADAARAPPAAAAAAAAKK